MGLAGVAIAGPGCSREPLEQVCGSLNAGSLAVSELRTRQSDVWGQYIELYNPTASELDLVGLALNLKKLDGSGERLIVVRDRDLKVAAGDFVVLGRFDNQDKPDHIDYGFADDFESDLYSDGLLTVYACDTQIDQLVFRDLPSLGSWSFDGAEVLTVDSNDIESNWCVDPTPAPGDGAPAGTPGEANRPCP
jgi:hypothetical protein